MEYFHVKVTVRSATNNIEFEFDLSVTDLHQRFLDPYSKGDAVVVNGRTVKMNDLEQIQISASSIDADTINSQLRYEQRQKGSFTAVNAATGRLADSLLFERATDVTRDFITGAPGHAASTQSEPTKEVRPATKAREVFVVHGRNAAAREAVFAFLRAIDLIPLEWNMAREETGKPSPYIGEILQAAFSRAHAVVVLLTPDDEVRLKPQFQTDGDPPHETRLIGQARPNVLFEAGMAMGSQPDRVVLVELGNLRRFTDIDGLHIVRMDSSSQRRQELAQKLRTAGCPVNLNGEDWHTAGGFDAAIRDSADESIDTQDTSVDSQELPQLSTEALELLVAAAQDRNGVILVARTMGGLIVQSNGKSFAKEGGARTEAKWEQAIDDLLMAGCIKPASNKGESFRITQKGYEIADSLDKGTNTP